MNNDWRDYELYHYGILGQKWGSRNGPPYPLPASKHSASEKKAGWRKSLTKGRANDAAQRKSHPDHNKINNKKAKDMSDQELRTALERRRMENEYERDRSSNSKGNAALKTIKRTTEVITTVTALATAVKTAAPYVKKGSELAEKVLK